MHLLKQFFTTISIFWPSWNSYTFFYNFVNELNLKSTYVLPNVSVCLIFARIKIQFSKLKLIGLVGLNIIRNKQFGAKIQIIQTLKIFHVWYYIYVYSIYCKYCTVVVKLEVTSFKLKEFIHIITHSFEISRILQN